MARYFFHRTDGHRDLDDVGSEMPDTDAARKEAVLYAAQTLRDHPEWVWKGQDLKVEVTDEVGSLLFIVAVVTIDAPVGGLRP